MGRAVFDLGVSAGYMSSRRALVRDCKGSNVCEVGQGALHCIMTNEDGGIFLWVVWPL